MVHSVGQVSRLITQAGVLLMKMKLLWQSRAHRAEIVLIRAQAAPRSTITFAAIKGAEQPCRAFRCAPVPKPGCPFQPGRGPRSGAVSLRQSERSLSCASRTTKEAQSRMSLQAPSASAGKTSLPFRASARHPDTWFDRKS